MIEILHGLAGSTFPKIVEARDDDQAPSRIVQRESDVAKIGVRDVLQFRQRAGGPDANHGTASVELEVERLDVRGGLRLAECDVDGGKNAAGEGQQMCRENNLRLAQTGVFENLRRVTVSEKSVSLEVFIHFDEVEIAARAFARAAGARLAIANDARAGGKQTRLRKRPQRKDHAGGITAGVGNQTSLGNFVRIELGNAVDGYRKPLSVWRGQLVPRCEGCRFAKAECSTQVNDAETRLD